MSNNPKNRSIKFFLLVFCGSAVFLLGMSWLILDKNLANAVDRWISAPGNNPLTYSLIVIGVLGSDLLLPVPSSSVIAHAGMNIGPTMGTLVGFLGMTGGSLAGYGIAKQLGTAYVQKKMDPAEFKQLNAATQRFGAILVVLLRPVPIFAEASVLLLAVGGMPFRPFLMWLSLSNLSVAIGFSFFGNWAKQQQFSELSILLVASLIPAGLLLFTRFLLKRAGEPEKVKNVHT